MRNVRDLLIITALILAAAPRLALADEPNAAATNAQPGGRQGMMMNRGGEGMSGGGMPMMGMRRGGMMEMMTDHTEGWIALLKTELKITDAQSAGWDAFADALRADTKGMTEMRTSMMGQQPAALPDRLAMHERLLSAHLEAVRRLKAAADPLYASFNDDQRKTADELMAPMGRM